MRVLLTDRYLQSLKPAAPGRRPIVWDAKTANFGVRITDRGVVSFVVVRRMPGQKQATKVTLGRYPAVSLAKARERAGAVLHDVAMGVHPRARAEQEAKAAADQGRAETEARQYTFESLANFYLEKRAAKKRTTAEIKKLVERHLLSRWTARLVTEIRRRDVIEMVEDVGEGSGIYAAKAAHTYASAIFNFGVAREYGGLQANPAHLVKVQELLGAMEARQRVLSDLEIRQIWDAAGKLPYPAGPFVKMLLITGQRRCEVAEMAWPELSLDDALWTVPAGRMKGNVEHVVPLPPVAVELLEALPRFERGSYVFTTSAGERPIRGFGGFRGAVDQVVAEAGAEIPDWRFHDLRRTMRTRLAALRVSPFVAELCIGHQQKGVHRVYDRHRYTAEKRDALERWASSLRSIVQPPPANVVPMRTAG